MPKIARWVAVIMLLSIASLNAAELRVVASIKPIHSVLAALMQGGVRPELLHGADQHPGVVRALDAAQTRLLQQADLLVWVGPELEPALAAGLAGLPDRVRTEALLDSSRMKILPSRTQDDRRDPYFWMDNRNIGILVDELTLLLQEMDPLRSHLYAANRTRLQGRLRTLDRQFENSYRGFKAAPAIQYLDTLQYFEQAYALKVAERLIEEPDEQPSAERLLRLRQMLQQGEAGCLLLERGVSSAHADTLTEGLKVPTEQLDSLGLGLSPGPDLYFQLMARHAEAIRGCLAMEVQESDKPVAKQATPMAPGAGVGRFMLTDHLGRLVTNQDMVGKFQVLYFGYTFCPDICPTSLAVLSQALQLLGERAELIQPWFITIDPQRDTTEVMRRYVTYFDPSLMGLSGPKAMIDRLADSLKVKYEKVIEPDRDPDLYVMDHSASLYLLDPQGRYVTKFLHGISPEQLHAELAKHLADYR